MSWIFVLGKNIIFFYGVFIYCILFFGIVCKYYTCVVLYDFWEIINFFKKKSLCGSFLL